MQTLFGNGDWAVGAAEGSRQLEKILHSVTFRNAPGLQKFLQYVISKAIAGLSGEIKEYSIAVEVLGKATNYDPRLDTAVRVQAHRLREKLEEYYGVEGADDSVIIELPKGHYVPQFSRRSGPSANGERGMPPPDAPGAPPRNAAIVSEAPAAAMGSQGNRRATLPSWRVAAVLAAALFASGVLLSPAIHRIAFFNKQVRQAHRMASATAQDPVQEVWAGFWRNSSQPVAAYSNSMFLVTQTSDLLRLKAADVDGLGAPAAAGEVLKLAANPRLVREAGPVFFNDGYTGTGEVMAVYYLSRLFSRFNFPLTVERSQLVSTDDLRDHNVIFLGSVLENPMLAGLSLDENFVFSQPQHPPILWRARIVNLHPLPGEAPFYEIQRDPKTQVIQADYALASFLPGVAPQREIVILAGLTTIGTQAAAQFITSQAGAETLLGHFGSQSSGSSVKRLPRYFQILLRVEVRKDEILNIRYVAGRAIVSTRQDS